MENRATFTEHETVTLPVQELKQLLERIESLEEAVRTLIEGADVDDGRSQAEILAGLECSLQQAKRGEVHPIEELWDRVHE